MWAAQTTFAAVSSAPPSVSAPQVTCYSDVIRARLPPSPISPLLFHSLAANDTPHPHPASALSLSRTQKACRTRFSSQSTTAPRT